MIPLSVFRVVMSLSLLLRECPSLVRRDLLLLVRQLRKVRRTKRQLLRGSDRLQAIDYDHQTVVCKLRARGENERDFEVRVASDVG